MDSTTISIMNLRRRSAGKQPDQQFHPSLGTVSVDNPILVAAAAARIASEREQDASRQAQVQRSVLAQLNTPATPSTSSSSSGTLPPRPTLTAVVESKATPSDAKDESSLSAALDNAMKLLGLEDVSDNLSSPRDSSGRLDFVSASASASLSSAFGSAQVETSLPEAKSDS